MAKELSEKEHQRLLELEKAIICAKEDVGYDKNALRYTTEKLQSLEAERAALLCEFKLKEK